MKTKAISTTYQSKINEILNEVNIDIIGFRQKGNEDLSQLQSIISIMQNNLDNSLNNTKSKTMSKSKNINKYIKRVKIDVDLYSF